MTTKMIKFHIPEDRELLAAIGEVMLRHEHLNHILKMTIKSIANLSPAEAIDATKYDGSYALRQRIRKLARKKLGEGEPLLKLQALLTRAERLTEKRNELTNVLWAEELDGDPGIMGAPGELRPIPSIEELKDLSKEIEALMKELNSARLDGFLKNALEEKQTHKSIT
jgi:hypothetical protein